MLESAVDRFGRAIAGAGAIEVGKDVRGSALEGSSEPADLGECGGDSVTDRVDQLAHRVSPTDAVGVAVGGDHLLVDAPRRLDLDMDVAREERVQAFRLLVGEKIRPGEQGPAGGVERVTLVAAVTEDAELNSPAALVEGVASQAHDVEGIHHRHRAGQFLSGGGLEPGEPIHRHDLHPLAPALGAGGEPGLERTLGTAFDHVEKARRAGSRANRGQVDDDGDVLVTATGVTPHVFIDADRAHGVEPGRVIDQDAATFG